MDKCICSISYTAVVNIYSSTIPIWVLNQTNLRYKNDKNRLLEQLHYDSSIESYIYKVPLFIFIILPIFLQML